MNLLGLDWLEWGLYLGIVACAVVMLLALLFAWCGEKLPPKD